MHDEREPDALLDFELSRLDVTRGPGQTNCPHVDYQRQPRSLDAFKLNQKI